MLEQCQKHVIATDTEFTNFQSIESKTDNSTFRFYSIPENKIRFALTAVLDGVQNNFYAAEFLTFGKSFFYLKVKNRFFSNLIFPRNLSIESLKMSI